MDMLIYLDTAGALLLATLSGIVVMHRQIHEGLIARIGLVGLSLGSGLMAMNLADGAVEVEPLLRSIALCFGGGIVAGVGLAWRIYREPSMRAAIQQASGWGELDPIEQ